MTGVIEPCRNDHSHTRQGIAGRDVVSGHRTWLINSAGLCPKCAQIRLAHDLMAPTGAWDPPAFFSATLTTPPSRKIIVVVHMFSGPRRDLDIGGQLQLLANQLGALEVWTENYDLKLAENHDLLNDVFFDKLMGRFKQREVQVLVGGPPCNTWCAARHLGPPGPRPIRTRQLPWGKEDLTSSEQAAVDISNELIFRFTALCFQVWRAFGHFVFEHPKDRGKPPYASVFCVWLTQWLRWATGAELVSFAQCSLGAASRKDTSLITTLPRLSLLNSDIYQGHPGQSLSTLRGKTPSGKFRTERGSLYPPGLTKEIALAIVAASQGLPQTTLVRGPGGAVRPPPGLEELRPSAEFRTKSGGYRPPDFIVTDKIVGWAWKEIFRLECKDDPAHINIKELRAARMFVRRYAQKGPKPHGIRLLLFCDSRVCVGAVARGRSASSYFNKHLKRFIPLCLGSHIYLTIVWIPTGANPGDPPSRGVSVQQWLREARLEAAERRLGPGDAALPPV